MSENVLPTFSSRSFIVSVLTFRYLIRFEFTCVYDDKELKTKFGSADFMTLVDTFPFKIKYSANARLK